MKLPSINGNEIVPVRLIPIITHGTLGQETLPGILANRLRVDAFQADPAEKTIELRVDGDLTNLSRKELGLSSRCAKDVNVFAYHLNENSEPVRMLSIEWDNIYRDISVLVPVLKKEEERIGVTDVLASEWSLKATKLLPPGVFLWRQDLDALWQFHCLFYCKWEGEHPDARTLIYNAYIRPEVRSLYFEGFEHFMPPNDKTAGKPSSAKEQAKNGIVPGKQSRKDTLAKVLHEIVTDFREHNGRKPQYNEVLAKIKSLIKSKKHPVIQEVSESKIYWLNKNGAEKTTSIHQLQNRLTRID